MVSGWAIYGIVLLIASQVGWMIYKDIKSIKKPDAKRTRIKIYAYIGAGAVVLFFGLKMFASGAMANLFYALGGRTF